MWRCSSLTPITFDICQPRILIKINPRSIMKFNKIFLLLFTLPFTVCQTNTTTILADAALRTAVQNLPYLATPHATPAETKARISAEQIVQEHLNDADEYALTRPVENG